MSDTMKKPTQKRLESLASRIKRDVPTIRTFAEAKRFAQLMKRVYPDVVHEVKVIQPQATYSSPTAGGPQLGRESMRLPNTWWEASAVSFLKGIVFLWVKVSVSDDCVHLDPVYVWGLGDK